MDDITLKIILVFFCFYIEKKNRFHDAVGLYSIVSQRMFSVFLPHFDVICYLLQNRCTALWNLFDKQICISISR